MGNSIYQRAPRDCWGSNAFSLYVDDIGINNSAALLGISARTVLNWKTGNPPRMACMALYWESRYGRGQINTEAQHLHELVCAQLELNKTELRNAHAAIESLLAEKAHGYCASNDGYFFDSGASTAMRHSAESFGR